MAASVTLMPCVTQQICNIIWGEKNLCFCFVAKFSLPVTSVSLALSRIHTTSQFNIRHVLLAGVFSPAKAQATECGNMGKLKWRKKYVY